MTVFVSHSFGASLLISVGFVFLPSLTTRSIAAAQEACLMTQAIAFRRHFHGDCTSLARRRGCSGADEAFNHLLDLPSKTRHELHWRHPHGPVMTTPGGLPGELGLEGWKKDSIELRFESEDGWYPFQRTTE